jgi:hypothetical protein
VTATRQVIKAIPTRYAGCHFRSRLEARWAVFFDSLGIAWEYEPQGFELVRGERYLPDFWLPLIEVWLEVKGGFSSIGVMQEVGPGEHVGPLLDAKWRAFHEAVNGPNGGYWKWFVASTSEGTIDLGPRLGTVPVATPGHPPRTTTPRTFLVGPVPSLKDLRENYGIMLGPGSPHSGWLWCRCRSCGEIDIGHACMESWMHCGAPAGHWDDYYRSHRYRIDAEDPRIMAAYAAARSARFEHGERGAT